MPRWPSIPRILHIVCSLRSAMVSPSVGLCACCVSRSESKGDARSRGNGDSCGDSGKCGTAAVRVPCGTPRNALACISDRSSYRRRFCASVPVVLPCGGASSRKSCTRDARSSCSEAPERQRPSDGNMTVAATSCTPCTAAESRQDR